MTIVHAAGVYSHTFVYERKDDCPVCTATVRQITLGKGDTLNQLIQMLCEGDLRLKAPSMSTTNKTLYMQKPPALVQKLTIHAGKLCGMARSCMMTIRC